MLSALEQARAWTTLVTMIVILSTFAAVDLAVSAVTRTHD